ncbi:wax ester/triacylglycerol synthase family O-acyltransferase [Rhodoferax sp. TS-BS-61-7]|uniref:wax ester/triacylglycerol synthase family O-acyltransferase n=1 Tax=Rhodoferax sp. TS-BS-61-7 TaxID=2094194 RepID=UPI000CF613EF|nr:wax ester/triacylglycerol synthase family O-acyltransferase [Rhodoferax sp. TS-BS-61-7]PQA78763.1 wax ester/triacylglycerol synthase family O-acyltransferase [Rhodoferax sp. TS-BS-61-7]
MNTLSGLDATFLYLETPQMPMHVGSFCLYELPDTPRFSLHKAISAHIGQRLHLAAVFTRKLGFMPLDLGHPVWLQAGEVDLGFHIRKVKGRALPLAQAQTLAAELHSGLIDRSRPLWEFHVFDRVLCPDGTVCGALYSKIHHATLDGKSGTILTQAMMDVGPTPRAVPPPDEKPRKAQSLKVGQMLGAVFSNSLAQYAKLARALPQAAQALGSTVARQSLQGKGSGLRPKSPFTLAPMTDFNVAVGTARSFGTASIPFEDCRAMAQAAGGSFNDIVLWICATALRSYLAQHGSIPRKPLLAAMPVSLREEGNTDYSTQASMTVVALGTHLAQPLKRLQAIMDSTAKVKTAMVQLKGMLPTDYPSLLAPWIVGGVAKAAFKTYSATGLSHRLPMVANLVISNVPGPRVPLYLAGARMQTFHPMSIVVHGIALNITVQTYAGSVDFGVIADAQAVPQVQDLTQALVAAFEEGRTLLGAAPAAAPVARATKKQSGPTKATAPRWGTAAKAATVKSPSKKQPAKRA